MPLVLKSFIDVALPITLGASAVWKLCVCPKTSEGSSCDVVLRFGIGTEICARAFIFILWIIAYHISFNVTVVGARFPTWLLCCGNVAAYSLMYLFAYILAWATATFFRVSSDIMYAFYYAIAFPGDGAKCGMAMLILWMASTVFRLIRARAWTRKVEKDIASNPHPTKFHNVIRLVGCDHVYCFLEPRDLLNLSLADHRIFGDVNSNLVRVIKHQLPVLMKVNTVEGDPPGGTLRLSAEPTFANKEALLDYMVGKLDSYGWRIRGASSAREESTRQIKTKLIEEERVILQLPYNATEETRERYEECLRKGFVAFSAYASFEGDRQEDDMILRLFSPTPIVQARRMLDGDYMQLLLFWDQNGFKFKLVRAWLQYILSRKDVEVQIWEWALDETEGICEAETVVRARGFNLYCLGEGIEFSIQNTR